MPLSIETAPANGFRRGHLKAAPAPSIVSCTCCSGSGIFSLRRKTASGSRQEPYKGPMCSAYPPPFDRNKPGCLYTAMSSSKAVLLSFMLTFFVLTSTAPSPLPSSPDPATTPLNQYLPPSLQIAPHNNASTVLASTCNRWYWKYSWTFDIWIRNKTTPERSDLGTGLFDNANHDCKNLIWTKNPTPISEDVSTGRVTAYYVAIEVNNGEAYDGCIEEAIWQAERKNVTCEIVPSPCPPDATSCGG